MIQQISLRDRFHPFKRTNLERRIVPGHWIVEIDLTPLYQLQNTRRSN